MAWSGAYQDAKSVYDTLDRDVVLRNGFTGKAISFSERKRETIEAELAVFTGPYRDILVEAEDLEIQNQTSQAMERYAQVMANYGKESPESQYLIDRIADLQMGKSAEESVSPALNRAARNNAMETAQFLLDNGADPDCENFYYNSPLHECRGSPLWPGIRTKRRSGPCPRCFRALPIACTARAYGSG